ncbi:MAG: amidohydrolase family protein [Gemmatimonadetes bacterium]|nr:amidohydrolase family protein [Gemmatimonadota bacterium]
MEILASATSNIARAYKVDRELGTLERGKIADLVMLDANPLESARNYRRISAVIKTARSSTSGAPGRSGDQSTQGEAVGGGGGARAGEGRVTGRRASRVMPVGVAHRISGRTAILLAVWSPRLSSIPCRFPCAASSSPSCYCWARRSSPLGLPRPSAPTCTTPTSRRPSRRS